MAVTYGRDVSNKRARQQAAERDCTVIVADDYTLQLDIDSEEDFERFEAQFERLLEYPETFNMLAEGSTYSIAASRSGNHHVTIKLTKAVDVKERIMLQACLGSDRTRELLSYIRVLKNEPEPVILFKPIKMLPKVKKQKQLTAGISAPGLY